MQVLGSLQNMHQNWFIQLEDKKLAPNIKHLTFKNSIITIIDA
jgi:hypothetical protein